MKRQPIQSLSASFGALETEDRLALSAVLLLPWAFGGVEIWAHRTAALLLIAAAGVALARRGPRDGLGIGRRALWLAPAVALALWALVQLVPLPDAAIRALSPSADRIYAEVFPGYPDALDAPGDIVEAIEVAALAAVPEVQGIAEPPRPAAVTQPGLGGRWSGWRTLSLLPSTGWERLHWYVALLAGFLVISTRCRDAAVARAYRDALFLSFLGLALFGLVYAASSNGKLYWVRETFQPTRPFGPYVNPTNFAGVMELCTPWLAGWAWVRWRRRGGGLPATLITAGALLCLVAALLTANRSAALILAAGLALLAVLAVQGTARRVGVLAGCAAAVGATALVFRHTLLGQRMEQFFDITGGSLEEVSRVVGWRSALGMWSDFSVAGCGFGAFRDVYPGYMPTGAGTRLVQLHNDYLEVLIEGGLVAGVLVALLLVGFWFRVLRRSLLLRRGRVNVEAVGLVLGILGLSVHAAFDFNHQIPANALLFVALAALAVGRAGAEDGS